MSAILSALARGQHADSSTVSRANWTRVATSCRRPCIGVSTVENAGRGVKEPLHPAIVPPVASDPRNRILSVAHTVEGKAMRVNWGAVVVAGIADWILGAVWFTGFKNSWQAGTRIPPEELQAYMAHPNFWPYIVSLVGSILIAYVIARLL